LLAALLDRLDDGYDRLLHTGPARLLRDWSRHSITLRQLVDVTTTAGRMTGRAEAVDGAGRLRVRRADGTVTAVGAAATLRLRPARRVPAAHGGGYAVRD
jgi:biotin-(acetyl-CoA carboxylase) ligase